MGTVAAGELIVGEYEEGPRRYKFPTGEPGLYKHGTNFTELIRTWDEAYLGDIQGSGGFNEFAGRYDYLYGFNVAADVILPEGVTYLYEVDCGNIVLPASLETISGGLYDYTDAQGTSYTEETVHMLTIYCKSTTPPEMPYGGTLSVDRLTKIVVPKGYGGAYKSHTNWCDYAEIIVEEGTICEGESSTVPSAFALFASGQLTTITAEDLAGISSISESGAFSSYGSLTEVTIPSNIKTIANSAFQYCENLAKVTLHEGLTDIYDYAFSGCPSLSEITIPSSVQAISYDAFSWCSGLSTVNLQEGLTVIRGWAFKGCSALTEITIPKTVSEIDYYVFQDCSSLKVIDFTQFTSIPKIDIYTFQNIPSDCIIKVPSALYNDFISATNWSKYAAQIVSG